MKNRLSFHVPNPERCNSVRAPNLVLLSLTLLAIWATIQPGTAQAGNLPAWIAAQLSAPVPDHDEETNAALLYSETLLTVQPNGKIKRLDRRVFKILRPDGSGRGIVRVDFDSASRVTNLRAWCIPAEGKIYEVGDRDAIESSLVGAENSELINDVRTKLLRIPASVPGSIVGYEVEVEEKPYIMTDEWVFQDTLPVREARYTLQLPNGWSYTAAWLNHAQESPSSVGSGQMQWVIRDQAAIRPEERMPPWEAIAGRLVISLLPPNGQAHGFQSWAEMGTWYRNLAGNRIDSSPEIKQKVAQLTASEPTVLGKMRLLASFVQNDIRYVAIELGIGGLQPHPAADVFVHRYGDCKDKATLLSSMLKEIGIDSYYFVINSERGAVTDGTPPHLAFDHVILAIRLPAGLEDTTLLAVSGRPKLGKLLFFDPTDSFTPFGRLAGALQSSYGLLVTPDGGELIQSPQLPTDSNTVQRTAKMTLDEAGTLRGDIYEVWSGDMASFQRRAMRSAVRDLDQIRPVESVVSGSLANVSILKASVGNARLSDQPFVWNYTIEAGNYAKGASGLLLVRPRILGTKSSGLLETKVPRQHSIEFEGPERDSDVFDIMLPQGYEVDELPPPVSADYGFVSYHSKTESVGHALRYSRTFEIKDVSVPVTKASQLKELFRIIDNDERMVAVLKPVHP